MGEPTWVDELQDRAVRDELDRRHPERLTMRPTDVAGVVAGFDAVDAMWKPTIAHAGALPSSILHDRVNGDTPSSRRCATWCSRPTPGSCAWRSAYRTGTTSGSAADLPPDAPPDTGPALEPVLELHANERAAVRDHLARTSEDDLRREVARAIRRRFPQGSHRPIDCYRLVLREEWWHHRFAERDLSIVEAGN